VLVIAHRGLPAATRTENTIGAVRSAFDSGADGVEVDVRLTADGALCLSHDPTLARLSGSPLAVAGSPWSHLRDSAALGGVLLACVEEVLVVAAGRRVVLELKKPPPAPSATARTALALAGQLRSLQRAGLPMDVTVSSFSATVVAHVRRLLPPSSGVRTAVLGRPLTAPSSLLRQALAAGHDEVHPHVLALLAAPGSIQQAHAVGVAVCPWTVNRRREVRRLAGLGVDALITDVPTSARAAVWAGAAPAR
jgi:glycerophosphoryl diester phosphodiesterase